MSVLAIDTRQVVTLEVADAQGEVHSYSIEAAPPGLDEFSLYLTRLDTGDRHRVAVDARGRWRCSCPDHRYRRSKGGDPRDKCKHVQNVKALRRLLESLAQMRTP